MKTNFLKIHEFKIQHTSEDKITGITKFSFKKNEWYEVHLNNDEDFLCTNDSVQVIVDELNKNVLAIVNLSRKIFYLSPILNYSTYKSMAYSVVRFFFILFISYSFCFGLVISNQLISFGDIFLGDIYDLMPYLIGISGFIALLWFWMSETKNVDSLLGDVYVLLKWPYISNETLSCFQATNSYFELQDNIYDIEKILPIVNHYPAIEAKEMIERWCKEKDQFDLSEFQREKFKLVRQTGHLNALSLKKIKKSEEHTDPFTHLKAKLDNLPIYGYADEFLSQDKASMTVIRSSFRDKQGFYFWYLNDEKRYLYFDEDMVTDVVYEDESWKVSVVIWIILLSLNGLFSLIVAASNDGEFIDQFCFAFLHILAFYLWVALLGWLYFKFYKPENKSQKQQNINAYVADQLKDLIELKDIKKLNELKKYRMKREGNGHFSRTGFDLKMKVGRFEKK